MRIGPLHTTRSALIGTLLVVLVAAGCVRLGMWQLDRLEQRDRLNVIIAARTAEPPVRLERLPEDTADWSFRRVRLQGECDATRPVVLAGRSRRGMPGVHLLCVFLPASGGPALLLDRGWVPAPDARTVEPALLRAELAPEAVEALLLPLPRAGGSAPERPAMDAGLRSDSGALSVEPHVEPDVLYRLNRRDASALLPHRISPLYGLLREPLPAGAELPVRPDPPDTTRGPHLGYAVQWFSFATIALIGWTALMWRRREVGWGGPPTGAGETPLPPVGTGKSET